MSQPNLQEVEITLENLLSLALGTPEIGAVNFNFLHEVVGEILKHLGKISDDQHKKGIFQDGDIKFQLQQSSGISKKLARITQEVDYRIAKGSRKKLGSRHKSVVAIPEVPQQTAISTSAAEPLHDAVPADKVPQTTSKTGEEGEGVPQGIPPVKSSSSTGKAASKASAEKVSSKIGIKKQSSKELRRRSSVALQQKISSRKTSLRDAEAVIVSRTILERKESKTPAGDMWHVLNVNRRVEAAEAAIQGMTNLIDTLNSDLEEMKNAEKAAAASQPPVPAATPSQTSNKRNSLIQQDPGANFSKQEQEVVKKMAAKLKVHDGKITGIETQVGEFVKQDQLKDLCNSEKVNELILEKLANLNSLGGFDNDDDTESIDEQPTPTPAAETPIASAETPAEAVEDSGVTSGAAPTEDEASKADEKKLSPTTQEEPVPKKKSSHHQRSKVFYLEVSAKLGYLENELRKANEYIQKVEQDTAEKYQALGNKVTDDEKDGKNAQPTKVVGVPDEATMKKINDDIQSLKTKIYDVTTSNNTEELKKLKLNGDSYDEQFARLTNAVNRLERDLEHVSDNFHRTQSDVMRNNQVSRRTTSTDDVQVNKLRGIIFDLQEQQTKLQNQLDDLHQDGINKTQKFKDVYKSLKDLKESKIGEEFVTKALEGYLTKDALEGKVDREQFDLCISELDQHIQDILQKLAEAENASTGALAALTSCLNDKAERDDIKQLRLYIDTRFKSFKPKVSVMKEQTEINAAATRKQLIPGCNCISCDRPCEIPVNAGIPIPGYQPLPGMKSLRPMTTFDLQSIRQSMHSPCGSNRDRFEMANTRDKLQKELLQLCGVRDLNELAMQTNRACGGVHTLVEQNRRNPLKPPMLYREEHAAMFQHNTEGQLFETDVVGRDGHIYKGRMKSPTHLPMIANKTVQENVPILPRPSIQPSGSDSPLLSNN